MSATKEHRRVGRDKKPQEQYPDTFQARVGLHLRALRESKSWTVDQLISHLKSHGKTVAKTTIYSWEIGDTSPTVDMLSVLAAVYGKSVRAMLPKE